MKTTAKHTSTGKFATTFVVLIVLTASLWAQPVTNYSSNEDATGAYARLEALMTVSELAARYSAPSADYDLISAAWDRLEALAEKVENELRYNSPEEVVPVTEEYFTEGSVTPDGWIMYLIYANNN